MPAYKQTKAKQLAKDVTSVAASDKQKRSLAVIVSFPQSEQYRIDNDWLES